MPTPITFHICSVCGRAATDTHGWQVGSLADLLGEEAEPGERYLVRCPDHRLPLPRAGQGRWRDILPLLIDEEDV